MTDPDLSTIIISAAASQPGCVSPVLTTRQRDVTLYTFTLTAKQLMELCRVERFGDHENGVNRQLNEAHAMRIAESMLTPDTTFAEGILGSLEGDWTFVDGTLCYEAGAYITLDDGQHRRAALEILNEEESERWEFTVTVTKDVPYAVRLKIFLQQTKGRSVDSRLQLAMRAELGDWNSPAEARAWDLCKDLASDPRSPLKGKIILGETSTRPYEGRHRPTGINAKGLHTTFTSLMSKSSPLVQLSPEKQLEVIKNLIRAGSHVWPRAWESERHILSTARGINALCKLVISGRSFRNAIGSNFSYENLVVVLDYASKFDWGVKKATNESVRSITERLDSAIGNGMARATAAELTAEQIQV